jgi:hypothetical protein
MILIDIFTRVNKADDINDLAEMLRFAGANPLLG